MKVEPLKNLVEAYDLWAKCGLRIDSPEGGRERSWKNYFARNSRFFLACYGDAGELWGVGVLFTDGRKASIYRLAVAPSARRKGIARAILGAAEQLAVSEGLGSFYAIVEYHSSESKKLFEDLGYIKIENVFYYTKSL